MRKRLARRAASVLAIALGTAGPMATAQNVYVQTNLIADTDLYGAQIVDPSMIDPWGMALRPPGAGGHIWLSNAMSGTSSEYIGDVNGIPLHQDGLKLVNIDTAGFADRGVSLVTGQVYNAASDFVGQPIEFPVAGPGHDLTTSPATPLGTISGSAKFVFVTEDGAINAWRSNSASAMDSAPVVIDYTKTSAYFPYTENSVFSGVAMTVHAANSTAFSIAGGNHLFATDFRHNAIQVFDNQWHDVTGAFHFATPGTVGGLHAFNVQDLGGRLFVTYADWNPEGDEGFEQTTGPGLGHVVEYNEDGTLVRDFQDGGNLNSPWGLALAPASFGPFANDLLVGNFGDGTISAFDLSTGAYVDNLRDPQGDAVTIDGLWALSFGNGVSLGDANALYFTAGPNAEQDGLFGRLNAVPEPTASLLALAGGAWLLTARRRTHPRRHTPVGR
ncbi:MAG TPA: TIGR03118 family protein [Chthoniobacteraceae bacterium]|jgi:uncharacterized protein (TIGR03118 family)|nr:TIGR03118 family protein [Chthoniobacteraceae bacterium]